MQVLKLIWGSDIVKKADDVRKKKTSDVPKKKGLRFTSKRLTMCVKKTGDVSKKRLQIYVKKADGVRQIGESFASSAHRGCIRSFSTHRHSSAFVNLLFIDIQSLLLSHHEN